MNDTEHELMRVMTELGAMMRVAFHGAAQDVIARELAEEASLRAYLATDGRSKQAEVARKAHVSQPTVSRLWKRWIGLGLAVEGEEGRARGLFDPGLYGVTLTSIRGKRKE